MRKTFSHLIVVLLLGCPLAAQAEKPADLSIYEIHPWLDGPIIGVAALGAALPLVYETQIIKKQCPCDSNEVNRIDRPVIQYHSQFARTMGDVTVALALGVPPLLDGMDLGFKNKAYVEDLVVYGEVLAVNSAVSNAFRYTTQRPRPDAYRASPAPSPPGGFASFYSGHTATVLAALSSASMTYNYRYGPHVWPWVVTAGVGLGAAATRTFSGRHFYSDAAVGAFAGTGIGILVPYLHKRNKESTVSISPVVSPESFQLVLGRHF